jgi:hypothetical protein
MKVSHSKLMRSTLTIMLALLTMGLLTPVSPTAAATSPLEFRNAMRKLWEDHITWTRLYIVSAAADLPDKDATAQRLLRNQEDIGNAIKPFYGDAAGSQLTTLLKDHILGAVDLIAAAKAGDNAKIQDASNKWYTNADDIATFLSNANPGNWPLDQMKLGMKMHLDLTLNEATNHLKGNYAADVADYDKVHEHILGLADVLASGIISQFPDRFSAPPSDAEMSLRVTMRKLWEDHITWTRLFIVSASANLPDMEATTQRLLQNQTDIGSAIKPLYGEAAGNQLTALLRDHILTAADLVLAAKAGDNAKVQDASNKWYANANDIATFLSSANPQNWPLDQMKMGMKMHLDLTLNEATNHLKGNYAVDVADYDKVHEHILGLADTLSAGIVNQFPGRFGGEPGAVGMPRTGNAQYSLWAAWFAIALVGGLGAVGGWLLLRRAASLRQSLAIHAGAAESRDVSGEIKR